MASGRNDGEQAVARARRFRKRMNVVEKVIWLRLARDQTGFRFRRQVPFENYVLDFYCAKLRLDVEIDGPAHDLRRESDARRDAWLVAKGVTVLRIPATLAYDHPDQAIELILAACRSRE